MEDFDIFQSYQNLNISKDTMELVRTRDPQHKKNAIFFFRDKIADCYRHRLGNQNVDMFVMGLSKEDMDELKREKQRRQDEEQRREGDRDQERALQERLPRGSRGPSGRDHVRRLLQKVRALQRIG